MAVKEWGIPAPSSFKVAEADKSRNGQNLSKECSAHYKNGEHVEREHGE